MATDTTSQDLQSAKRDNRFTDKRYSELQQKALQESLQIFAGKTIPTTPTSLPDARTYSQIQTMFDDLRNLHILPTTEVEPDIQPDDTLLSSSATTNVPFTSPPTEPPEPPPNLDAPMPAPTGNFMADPIFAFLA
jgi:hypothetical protein